MTASQFTTSAGRVPGTRRVGVLSLLALLGVAAPRSHAQTNAPAEEFTAFAINMGTYTRGTTANLIITVNRWTSEAEKEKLFALLDPSRIDVSLSEEFQLEPEQSTSAIIVHHSQAKYFSIE